MRVRARTAFGITEAYRSTTSPLESVARSRIWISFRPSTQCSPPISAKSRLPRTSWLTISRIDAFASAAPSR